VCFTWRFGPAGAQGGGAFDVVVANTLQFHDSCEMVLHCLETVDAHMVDRLKVLATFDSHAMVIDD
jgi:hypothetical protein